MTDDTIEQDGIRAKRTSLRATCPHDWHVASQLDKGRAYVSKLGIRTWQQTRRAIRQP